MAQVVWGLIREEDSVNKTMQNELKQITSQFIPFHRMKWARLPRKMGQIAVQNEPDYNMA